MRDQLHPLEELGLVQTRHEAHRAHAVREQLIRNAVPRRLRLPHHLVAGRERVRREVPREADVAGHQRRRELLEALLHAALRLGVPLAVLLARDQRALEQREHVLHALDFFRAVGARIEGLEALAALAALVAVGSGLADDRRRHHLRGGDDLRLADRFFGQAGADLGQLLPERGRVREAVIAFVRERAIDHRHQRERRVVEHARERARRTRRRGHQHLARGLGFVHRQTGEQRERGRADGVEIGALIDVVPAAHRLLGRHERRRAHDHAGLRLARVLLAQARDAEVEHLELAGLESRTGSRA